MSDNESLESKLAQGIGFADMLGFNNKNGIEENKVLLNAILELLVSKGIIRLHELEDRKKQVAKYFQENNTGPQVHLLETTDKYDADNQVDIDCDNLLHLCKGSCCRLWFSLSTQDLDEGIVRWDYKQPYSIAKKSDGYCHHCSSDKKCTVYENRPIVCRTYDCRNDKRIWLDFENKVINPDIEKEEWPNVNK
jgi:Fe-S-cluster containining protein